MSTRLNRLALACALALALAGAGCEEQMLRHKQQVIDPWIGDGKTSVLVDTAHQWEGRPDFVLDGHEFRYCHSQSTSRMLANLIRHDFRYRQFRAGPITRALLDQHDVLFINVPTFVFGGRSKPERKFEKYTQAEIEAIVGFVEDGGGLFVAAEHNNVYDNASVLNPLMKHFGVEIPAAYAREPRGSEYCIGRHDILIRIHHEAGHPVNRKVRETSWLGGGPLVTEHGVTFMSDKGHADIGNYITGEPFKHSNRRVDEGERTGSGIPLVAAFEQGKGRVVVIGDHNVLGVQWLGIADNYRFAMNVFAWLAGRENEEPHIADIPPLGVKLGFDLPRTEWNPGLRDRRGFHPMFINFSRDPRLFPLGLLELDEWADVLFFADPPGTYGQKELKIIDERLARGERMVLMFDPSEPQPGSVELLQHLLPDLAIRAGERTLGLDDLKPSQPPEITRLTGRALPVSSPDLDLGRGIEVAAIQPSYKGRGKYRSPHEIERGKPYLLDIGIEQGAPFIDAATPDGRKITIARRFAVGGGELVLFAQAKLWSNESFGTMREEPVNDNAYGSHDLQLAFGRWLAEQAPAIDEAKGKLVPLAPRADAGVEDEASPAESE